MTPIHYIREPYKLIHRVVVQLLCGCCSKTLLGPMFDFVSVGFQVWLFFLVVGVIVSVCIVLYHAQKIRSWSKEDVLMVDAMWLAAFFHCSHGIPFPFQSCDLILSPSFLRFVCIFLFVCYLLTVVILILVDPCSV